jgi:tripartite-type tricarboxylate transporter receptor subunit TctC
MFISMTGIRITHVPYKGTGPAITAVIAGEVPFVFAVIGSALPSVRAGKLKALAVTSVRRSALAPDLPTVAESGVPGYEAVTWFGILAPRGTPQSIIGLLNREIVAVLRSNDFHDRLVAMGIEPVVSTPKEFADFLQTEIAKWGKVIRDAGIRAE